MDKGYVVMCAPNARDLWTRQLLCKYAYGQTRIRANTPMNETTDRADTHTIYYWPTDRTDTHTIYHRPTDCADMPTILITVVLICLRPKHDQVELCSLECNPVAGTVLLSKLTSSTYISSASFTLCFWYINKVYILVVLRTKKELPVLEYIDRGYMVICLIKI